MSHLNLPKRIHKIPDDFDGDLFQRFRDADTIEDLNMKCSYLNRPRYDIVDGHVVFPIGDEINITLVDNTVIKGVKKIEKRSDIINGVKLYCQINSTHIPNICGKFKEIKEPEKFRDSDDRLDDIHYIKHHNFVVSNNS